MDEIDLDAVPLYVCGIVHGSPYVYDRHAIFFEKEKKYHIKKHGVEYIVRAHSMEDNSPLSV